MNDQSKSRFAIDLDDLERQLRHTAGSQPKAASADPLAELARIVGQDDPFKAIFNEKKPGSPVMGASVAPMTAPASAPDGAPIQQPIGGRSEPSLDELLRSLEARSPAAASEPASAATAPAAGMSEKDVLDEFDAMLRDELRGPVEASPTSASSDLHAQTARYDWDGPAPAVDAPGHPASFEAEPAMAASARDVDYSPRDLDSRTPEARDLDQFAPHAPASAQADDYPEPPAEPVDDMRSLEPQQPRKGLVIAGALLGVAVLGVGAVVGLRGLGGSSAPRPGAEPPVIRAEAGPARVQPQNPGGVEIPNQNKQIYERAPEPRPGETRVVNREEQPIDVQAATRATPRVILPGPGAVPGNGAAVPAGTQVAPGVVAVAPAQSAPASAAPAPGQNDQSATLGEPRRVRTVAVRPDGTIATPTNGASPATTAATSPAAPPAATPAPRVQAPTPPPPRPVATAPAATPAPAARPAATDDAVTRAAAAAQRQQVAAAPPAQPVQPASREAPAGGGFMVQLGAPGSEAEARTTFAALQRRYGDALAGESPVIRRADVGGRTVYRLRIGPYSRSDAAEKCQAIQAAGGQCFIAGN